MTTGQPNTESPQSSLEVRGKLDPLSEVRYPEENSFSSANFIQNEIGTKLDLPLKENRKPSQIEADQLYFTLSKVCRVPGLTLDQAAEIRGGGQRDASLMIDGRMFKTQSMPSNLLSQWAEVNAGKGLFVTQPTELTSSGGRVNIMQEGGSRTEIFFMGNNQLEVSVYNSAGRLIFPPQEGGNRKIDLTDKDHYRRITDWVDYLIGIHSQNPRFKEGFPNNQLQQVLTEINNTLPQSPVNRDLLQNVAAEPRKPGETLLTLELQNQLEQNLSQLTDERSRMIFKTIISDIDSLKIYNQEDVRMILKMLQDPAIISEWNTFTTELTRGQINVIDPNQYQSHWVQKANNGRGIDKIVSLIAKNYFDIPRDTPQIPDSLINKFNMARIKIKTVLDAAVLLRVRSQVARTVDESVGYPYRVVDYSFNNLLITFTDAVNLIKKYQSDSPKIESDYQRRSEWLKGLYRNWKQQVAGEIKADQEKSAKEVGQLINNTLY